MHQDVLCSRLSEMGDSEGAARVPYVDTGAMGSDSRAERMRVDPEASHEVDLSLIVNIFREGRLIHPTLRSLADSVRAVIASGRTAEVVLVMDRSDPATYRYLDEFGLALFDGIPTRRLDVDNGDLGLSRNSGVASSLGGVIAFSDDDNLYSPNWLVDAIAIINGRPQDRVILHPAVLINFEARDIYWESEWSTSAAFDARGLVENNYWDSSCVARREVFLDVPYAPSLAGPGFGPEDWHWNCETLDRGWSHEGIPGSVMFYRVKSRGSLISRLEEGRALLAPTSFLTHRPPKPRSTRVTSSDQRVTARFQRSLDAARALVRLSARVSRPLVKVHPRFRPFRKQVGQALVQLLEPPTGPVDLGRAPQFPDWLVTAWRAAHEYEPSLFPSSTRMAAMFRWEPRPGAFSHMYWELVDDMTVGDEVVDYVFLIPWLSIGGANTVVDNYVRAIREMDPDAHILVLSTVPTGERHRIDTRGVRYRSLPDAFFFQSEYHQARLLGTALVQLAPRVVHVINSPIGYRVLERYSHLVHQRSRLYISLFTLDESPEGQKTHYVLNAIRDYVDELDSVISDNQPLVDLLVETYALDANQLFVHHQSPAAAAWETVPGRDVALEASDRLRVLWAARLDRQKRPDILMRVAERCRQLELPIDFFASGSAVVDAAGGLKSRLAKAGVQYLGDYRETVASLPGKYDVLLLTSQWEGLPLTLMDGALHGLTLVAPAVGGIPDFIDDGHTGFLIDAFDDIDAYVSRLSTLAAHPDVLRSTRAAAAERANRNHSWQAFTTTLAALPGYLDR